ncbi:hypothetical protein MtrunA17_Chr5g0400551 [Medicago truncatula]|uniref:Uncharacterized protein n=1 Tax=Medicago truncatula TaxID=3880 RepID=G7JZY2_MEDTR|nr:uncharacterized protein LOC11423791 [Medicago truncatula]AES94436.1 hypothetical protein MTR_5g014370 [Medicago truncatula]RHN53868.1 hypothetical protein MtrunA17_Chr5g0400551 [Medicago truncatula]
MDCLVMPVSLIRRRSTSSRLGYRPLTNDGLDQQDSDSRVTVVVGKEKKVFLVDPIILQENPFKVLMDISMKKDPTKKKKDHFHFSSSQQRVIFVDVDDILFEHMLWLMNNDTSSLFQLNLKDIVDFYTHDDM